MTASDTKQVWSPSDIDQWRVYLSQGIDEALPGISDDFISNLTSSLQYLEYLNYLLTETELHPAIERQLIKTYVIVTMSVIESILYYVLHANSKLLEDEWEDVEQFEHILRSSDKKDPIKLRATFQKKLSDPRLKEISLNQMSHRVEKHKFLDIDHEAYESINHLRKLRNRVHIYKDDTEPASGADQDVFHHRHFKQSKKVLHAVLSSPQFNLSEAGESESGLLDFLQDAGSLTDK